MERRVMTKSEREDLIRLIKQREKVAKTAAENNVKIDRDTVCDHVWLRLADGRALDPTLDQFDVALPAVYLGKAIRRYHWRAVPFGAAATTLRSV